MVFAIEQCMTLWGVADGISPQWQDVIGDVPAEIYPGYTIPTAKETEFLKTVAVDLKCIYPTKTKKKAILANM